MSQFILTDTGYWIGLIDEADQYYDDCHAIFDLIKSNKVVVPWPCLYEILKTRNTKRKYFTDQLELALKKHDVEYIADTPYKEIALEKTFRNIHYNKQYRSLADNVIREILSDRNISIDFLVTFNQKDFSDLCLKRNISILDNQ